MLELLRVRSFHLFLRAVRRLRDPREKREKCTRVMQIETASVGFPPAGRSEN